MPVKIQSDSPDGLLPLKHIKRTGMPTAPIILSVAPPGWGKTEFAMSNPKCLLAACQEGHSGVDGYKVVITSWDNKELPPRRHNGIMHLSFVQLVKEIERDPTSLPYDFIAIDTIDDLVKMLVDESMIRLRIKHLSDLDFGKGYDLGQNSPFRKTFGRLTKCGLGIMLITHENIVEHNFKKEKKSKKETTLPNGIYKQIFPICESVLHGVFGRRRKGQVRRDRIFVTEGSEEILAKNRYGALPAAWIVPSDLKERWEQFVSFWSDEKVCDAAFKDYETIYGED